MKKEVHLCEQTNIFQSNYCKLKHIVSGLIFFNQETLTQMLTKHGFVNIVHNDDVLPKSDIWNGDNVIFTISSK